VQAVAWLGEGSSILSGERKERAAVKKSSCWVCEVTDEGDVLYGKVAVVIRVFPQATFSPLHRFRLAHVPANWVLGAHYGSIKWSGSEADHSPALCGKVRNVWCCTSTPSYVFMAWC